MALPHQMPATFVPPQPEPAIAHPVPATFPPPPVPGLTMQQPAQHLMVGVPVANANPGFAILEQLPSVKVKQKIEWLEVITGFETQNQYSILDPTKKPIMQVKEDSNCLARQCCLGPCRPYNFDIKLVDGSLFLHIERPFACTIACYNRPEITVYDSANQVLGYISDPFACCSYTFDIMDASRNKILRMEASICQWAQFCPCPGNAIEFMIKDVSTDAQVGSMKKVFRFANWFSATDADSYEIEFQEIIHPHRKAMLIALALFLDMNYFEK